MAVRSTERAFTLTEVIVVGAILGLLISILHPIIGSAKRKASENQCISNLRQIGIATALYRETHDGAEVGSPAQMGLPPMREVSRQLIELRCREPNFRNCTGPNPYRIHWTPSEFATPESDVEWSKYVTARGTKSILYFDSGHGEACPGTGLSLNKSIASFVDTSVLVRVKRLTIDSPDGFFN